MDLRYTLCMLCVPLLGASWFFGDNKGMFQSSSIPHLKLSKQWNALSYHRVREAVVTKSIIFLHIDGRKNVSDILTKSLRSNDRRNFVTAIMDFKGDTLSYLPNPDGKDHAESMGRIEESHNCNS